MELRKLQKVAEGERTDEQKAAIAALEKQVEELKQAASKFFLEQKKKQTNK